MDWVSHLAHEAFRPYHEEQVPANSRSPYRPVRGWLLRQVFPSIGCTPQLIQCKPKIVMRLCQRGIISYGLFEMLFRRIETSLVEQCDSLLIMSGSGLLRCGRSNQWLILVMLVDTPSHQDNQQSTAHPPSQTHISS